MKFFIINPGSTSTEVAVFHKDEERWQQVIEHSREDLAEFDAVIDQLDWRERLIREELKKSGFTPSDFEAIVARGGLVAPIPGGTYRINEEMKEDLLSCSYGEHASNLAGVIALRIAEEMDIPAYTVNPVAVDEFIDVARISGLAELPRKCQSHALNLKGVAHRCAAGLGEKLSDINLIGSHLGGGISIASLKGGRIVDVNNANQGGPFSPERTGTLPAMDLVDYIFEENPEKSELKKMLVGGGGLTAYLGTSDARKVENMISAGDKEAEKIYQAMIYQIAREIGRMSTVLSGDVDAIFITGGLANSQYITEELKEKVEKIAPVHIFPGSDEARNLADGALRVLQGEEKAKNYSESRLDTGV